MSRSKRTEKQIRNTREQRYDYIGDKNVADKLQEIEFMPSSLETIDGAMLNFVDEDLNMSIQTNNGFKKVPVLWVTAERAYQIKHNKDLRDKEETLILPLITVNRSSVTKEQNFRGDVFANIYPVDDPKGGTITIARNINPKKTAEFQNNIARRKYANGRVSGQGSGQGTYPGIVDEKVVYETVTIPLPVWVSALYEISIRTEYQQQMNDLATPLLRQGGLNSMPRRLERDGHKFEAFINGSFTNNANTNSLDMTQRNYETTISLEVLGYLIGDGPNDDRPKIVIRENAVEVKIPREHVIMGDIDEYLDKRGFYRE